MGSRVGREGESSWTKVDQLGFPNFILGETEKGGGEGCSTAFGFLLSSPVGVSLRVGWKGAG